jgi:hypothetical protein
MRLFRFREVARPLPSWIAQALNAGPDNHAQRQEQKDLDA